MAGKPEHSITHPAPPNHIHQQLYHHHHQHQQSHNFQNHQNNRRTHHISHNDSQELQQNSVLVYVPNENFSYTTVDEQNAGANYQTSQHQQANNYQVATELFNKSGYRAGISDLQNEVDCCLDKSIELINRQNDTHQDEEDNYSQNYRSNSVNLSIGRATGSPINSGKIDLGVFSSSGSLGSARSPSQSDAESLSSASDSGVVATAIAATRSALPSSAIIVSECEDKNHFASYEVPCYTSGINYVRNNSSNSIRISQEGSEGCRRENSGSERRCDSVRSDTGESAYSSNLSSPECQSVVQGSDAILANCGGVVVQQAAHLVTQVNVGNSNNGVLNMNGSEVTQQTHQQQAAIAAPRGWKRICTNGVIIYISPSSTALGSLDQLKEYLTTAGTCKCGLECPLRPEQVFNFDPKVATRPWSPDQGETREMTKLCNHKRKLLLSAAAASPVASCTPVVSSSVLPAQGTLGTIHPCAESPTPSDKTKKDGLSKKKKRKLGSVGNVYSGVSVSQLLAQRERAIAVAGTTGVQGLPASNGSQVWPITALPLQQNSQQIGHQSINSPMQNLEVNNCAVRNSQQRLNPHNMTSMLMGNPLIMNQQGTNFNNMNQYHMNQYQSQPQNQSIYNQQTQQMQILHHDQQPQNQHHQNVISNQLTHQQTSHYVNQMNENSVHNMQQQNHMNQQQQIHLQAMQKHSQAQHGHNNQDPCQQQMQNYNNTHHTNDGFVHHSSQNSLHPSMHQFHQHSMPHQQSSNSHMMQNQGPDPFQMQNSHQMQQYNNQNMNHHVDIVQQSNGQIISGMNPSDVQMRHNRNHTMNDDEINAKQMAQHQHQQQILMHNHNMERHHPQSENLQNLNHENMQRMYNNHQVQFQRNCELNKNGNMDAKNVHQQYMLVSQAGRSPNNGNVIEVQSIMGSVQNGNPNNLHSNQRTQMWQQQNNRSIAPSHPSPTIPVSIQNISCNSMDRVPPLHHHIPQAASWPDEVARKKSKPSKSLAKKQRHHNIPEKTIRNNNIEELSASPRNEFEKLNSNNQIGSTVSNSSPSFLDDPSGYLAQQTALLNSTISRQTGVTSSQMMIVNNTKNPQGHNENHLGNNNYVPQHQKPTSSVKNHATSPVVVHSSMTPTSVGSNTNDSDSADTQSYIQDQYHNKTINRQFMINGDQDPVTSSTFGERFVMDSRPIQGGTISTSHGSPIGTNSPTNNPDNSNSCISQPTTPQSLISSQPSTPHSYSQPPTPHSSQIPPQSLTPVSQQAPSQSSNNQIHDQIITSASSTISPSTSPTENLSPTISKKSRRTPEGYQPHPHTINSVQKPSIMNYTGNSTVITTMASGHTFSSNTITSVLAGKANTATVSINKPSGIPNPAIPNIISTKSSQGNTIVTTGVLNRTNSSPIQTQTTIVTKSPLEMVQSVVSSIQVPQTSSTISQQQQNVQVHNVLTSSGVLKHSTASGLPPGHILVSSGGQLIMASTGNGIGGVMAPPPPKIISNSNSMPPLSVSPMVTSVTGAVSQVIPAVGVAQQVNLQPTVLVNTIQTPVLIQPSVMTMDGIGQNVQIPHLTVATGNVIQNAQSILDANQDVTRTVNTNSRLLSPESNSMTKKKVYKKRKNHTQTVASMLHIASSQQNTGMLMQSQSNFTQQNFQAPMLQALTIVPGKGGAPAQLVMNGQTSATNQFNTQQIITNQQPTQQINLLQPVNLLNGTTGMMQNFPTIQQFIVPGLGSMVMSADGTATLLQDTTGNLGMQLQIQNVNGQNVLTPVQSHSGIFGQSQSILAAGPAGMVIRAPQQTSGKLIQQHSPGAQFLSPNSGQFLVNGTTSFGNQLSPIVANVSPNQQVTFNTSQVRPSNIQGQQEFIQMNGQTLMVPCATAQNLAVSSSSNQQNTTFVQQNTTIVQQQTTMVSNNQIPDFQTVAGSNGNVDQSLNLDHNHQSYILSASGMIQGKSPTSPKNLRINSPGSDNSGDNQQNNSTQQFILTGNGGNGNSRGLIISDKNGQQSGEISPNMVRHSVSTQTAGNQANMGQSALMRQGSPPDTTTHSPGNSQRSNSPAVDTTTHGAASPAPPMTSRHHSSSTPMVHCISSSEPDSGDLQASTDDWQNHGITTKEITLNQPGLNGKTYVESTVTTGIQIYTSETLKQAEGVVSTMRCEGRDLALGRGIKRKLDSIHSMHSTLHGDQDESEDQTGNGNYWKVEIGELVWGAALGSPAWPGKVESLGPPGTLTVWVRWYGGGDGLTQVEIQNLKSLSDGLEAHHRARKRFRKNRKLNMPLENAIQEAMAELDNLSEKDEHSKREILL